jgi:hypothetical protein
MVPKAPPAVSCFVSVDDADVPKVTKPHDVKGTTLNPTEPAERSNPYMAKMLWARQITTSDVRRLRFHAC